MRLKYFSIFALSCLSLLGVSCSEDLSPTPFTFPKTFTGAISKTWKMKLFEVVENDKVVNRFINACWKDDVFRFYSDHTYETTNGSVLCEGEEASSVQSTWSYASATATLTFLFLPLNDTPLPFFLRDADDEDMQIEIFTDNTNTLSYRIQLELVDEE